MWKHRITESNHYKTKLLTYTTQAANGQWLRRPNCMKLYTTGAVPSWAPTAPCRLLSLEGVGAAVPRGCASGALAGRLALSGLCAPGEPLLSFATLRASSFSEAVEDTCSALGQDGRSHASTAGAATDVTPKGASGCFTKQGCR